MNRFKKAPKPKEALGSYPFRIKPEANAPLLALGVLRKHDGKPTLIDFPPWCWLVDLCDQADVDLGDVLSQFGESLAPQFAALSRTRNGRAALGTLRQYFEKQGAPPRSDDPSERPVTALLREFTRPTKRVRSPASKKSPA